MNEIYHHINNGKHTQSARLRQICLGSLDQADKTYLNVLSQDKLFCFTTLFYLSSS